MKNKIIFSVFQNGYSIDENYINTIRMEKELKRSKIEFKALQGMYKGIHEESFAIDLKWLNEALALTQRFNQESVLIVDQDGRATLKYLPTNLKPDVNLGYFIQVSESKAKTQDAYTYDMDSETYYICERRKHERISFDTRTWNIE
jgi:hypothetical protein